MTSVVDGATISVPTTRTRWSRGAAVAAVAAGLVLVARASGALEGTWALLAAAVVVVAPPTSRTLSRRLLIASGLLPWLAVLWWVPLPSEEPGRVSALLAAGAGLLCGYVAAAPAPQTRLRLLVPQVSLVDLAPLAAGAAACWPLWPWLTAPDVRHALAALTRGWDNSAHFAMTDLVLREGAVTASLPRSYDGSPWGFTEYPQHFQTAVAALVELATGSAERSPVEQLLPYTRALAIVLLLGVVSVVAAISSLPTARRRPGVTAALTALLVLVYAFGPGLRSLEVGHANFLMATETVVVATALSIIVRAEGSWLAFAALSGTVVAVANEWMPLSALTGAAFVSALFSSVVRRRSDRSKTLFLIAVTAVASLAGVPRLLSLDVGHVLVLAGEVQAESIYLALCLPLVAIAVMVLAACRPTRAPSNGEASPPVALPRGALLGAAVVPLAGLCLFTAIFVYQVSSTGHASYYSIKLLTGTYLASWGIAGIAIPSLAPSIKRTRDRIVALGLVAPLLVALMVTGVREVTRAHSEATSARRLHSADRLLSAAARSGGLPKGETFYLGVAPGDLILVNGDQWFCALTGTWTRSRSYVDTRIPAGVISREEVIRAAATVLRENPGIYVVVNPIDASWIRNGLPTRWNPQIVTWPGPATHD